MKSAGDSEKCQTPKMQEVPHCGVSRESELCEKLGLRDLVVTPVLLIVGLPWSSVASKLGPSHLVLCLLAIVVLWLE